MAGTLSSAPSMSIESAGTDDTIFIPVRPDNADKYEPETIFPISFKADISISEKSAIPFSS